MMRTLALVSCILIAGLAAQQRPSTDVRERQARQNPRAFRQLEIPGEQVAQNVSKLTQELHWHQTLRSALRAARSEDKPVLWVQALGDLQGFL